MQINSQERFNRTPLLLAMMILATGQVGVSVYLPALPAISRDLMVGQDQVQLLVTLFLVGFGLSQLFYGPASDAMGRRPIFIMGQGVYLLGTIICVLMVDSFSGLVVGRLLQGLGAGSASVLGRSVLRDSYSGFTLTKALSYMSIMASILPILGPVIGGWIAWHFGWQWIFGFVLIYIGAIFTLGLAILPETLPYKPQPFKVLSVLKTYSTLIKNRQIITSASYNWLSYLSTVVSISLMPFLLQDGLGLTIAEYGELMIIPSAGLLVGSVMLNRLNQKFSSAQLLSSSFLISAIAGLILISTPTSLYSLIGAFTLLTISQGISFPLSITLLLSPHTNNVGAISALSGSIQMCFAGLLGGFLVQEFITNQLSLGLFYVVSACCMATILLFNYKYQTFNQTATNS